MTKEDMLRALMASGVGTLTIGDDDEDAKPKRALKDSWSPQSPEACIEMLQAYFDRRNAPIAFNIGDVVYPRQDSPYKQTGRPQIVIDFRDKVHWSKSDTDPSSNTYGQTEDMWVAAFSHGTIVQYWVDSAAYEPWIGAPHQLVSK